MDNYAGRRILIVGLARSGVCAAKMLCELGAVVTVNDSKTAEQLEPARKALEKDYNFVVQDLAAHQCLNGELINRKFDKGRGVRIVADTFGVDLSDTIGFGDSMNDLEMIETVGTSVCMDNGSPALKEKSDIICPAVEEDGLAWAFEKLSLI